MKTRRSPKNQQRLWKAIGRQLQADADAHADPPAPAKKSLFRVCIYCGKSRVEENMHVTPDGKRAYCTSKEYRLGERKYGGMVRK
jgi:hypothetical protein